MWTGTLWEVLSLLPGGGRITGDRKDGEGLEAFIFLVGPQETSLEHPQSLRMQVGGHTPLSSNTPGMQHLPHGVKRSRVWREEGL